MNKDEKLSAIRSFLLNNIDRCCICALGIFFIAAYFGRVLVDALIISSTSLMYNTVLIYVHIVFVCLVAYLIATVNVVSIRGTKRTGGFHNFVVLGDSRDMPKPLPWLLSGLGLGYHSTSVLYFGKVDGHWLEYLYAVGLIWHFALFAMIAREFNAHIRSAKPRF